MAGGPPSLDETQWPAREKGVRVFVRLRPPDEEDGTEMFEFEQTRRGLVTIKDPLSRGRSEHTYEFNGIFQPADKQEQVFVPVAAPIVDAAFAGSSGCILAYGQTGSGKTYSMFGEGNRSGRGLLPRAIERLFEKLHDLANTTLKEPPSISSAMSGSLGLKPSEAPVILTPTVAVSFLEVYLDKVLDLGRFSLDEEDDTSFNTSRKGVSKSAAGTRSQLGASLGSTAGAQRGGSVASTCRESLDIRENVSGMAQVRGLARLPVQDFEEVKRIIDMGLSKRVTAKTFSNNQSSRSHTVFTVYLPRTPDPKAPPLPQAVDESEGEFADSITLSFVDLAGSERLAKSKAEGQRFQEAVSINSSLTALGKVILALTSDPSSIKHVPYRESKLTRILSPSFALGANVALLATIHPRMEDYAECLQTLSWADNCKNMRRQPQVSYISQKQSAQKRVKDLQTEIVRLKEQIKQVQAETAAEVNRVSGIGASGKVDEIEMQIAKVIVNEGTGPLQGSKPSSVRGSSKASEQAGSAKDSSGAVPEDKQMRSDRLWAEAERRELRDQTARERSVAALFELQEERKRQSEALEKADQRMQVLDKERCQLAELEEIRAVSTADLTQRGAELEADLNRVQEKLREVLEAQSQRHNKAVSSLKGSTEKRVQVADMALLRVPAQLKERMDIAESKREELDELRKASETTHLERMRQLKKDHEKELQDLAAQWKVRLNDKEASNAQCAKEFSALRDRQKQLASQCQAELLSLYELMMKHAKLTADIDDGKHPLCWRGGLKEVVLPQGARPSLPQLEAYPQLFDAIAREEEKSLSGGAAWRRSGSGGIAAVAAAEAIRKEGDGSALEAMKTDWDATPTVLSLCKAESDSEAESILAKLSAAHCRRLCVELRNHSVELFSPGEEREALHRAALTALEDGSTDHYIKNLDQRRSVEQAALSDVVEHALQLKSWLGCRKNSLDATSQQSLSRLTNRSLSRPITPFPSRPGSAKPGSRPNSRPGTAINSRPPPQPAYPANARNAAY